jgi:hypothetical protein
MNHSVDQLKRKLRRLKKLEITIRFKRVPITGKPKLIWDVFFSTKAEDDHSVKYPLSQMLEMDHEKLKAVFEEYFYRIYFQSYKENGLTVADVHDPNLLELLDLPPHASARDIKSRFRQLAMRYHPDRGGDSARFIELVDIYGRLKDEQDS